MDYSFQLAASILLYASSHRHMPQRVEHWLEREIAQWVHYEGSTRWPIAPWANALTTELHLAPYCNIEWFCTLNCVQLISIPTDFTFKIPEFVLRGEPSPFQPCTLNTAPSMVEWWDEVWVILHIKLCAAYLSTNIPPTGVIYFELRCMFVLQIS